MDTIANRIRQGMEIRNMKQVDIIERTGINKGALSSYVSGKYAPKQNNIYKIAQALDVNEAWLMGHDVPMERKSDNHDTHSTTDHLTISNIYPIEKKKFPLLGNVACGQPTLATENFEGYIESGSNIHADFCLKAKGDSMVNARILDGDIVFIRKQDMVENGEIAAVLIDDEATLKRFYMSNDLVQLIAENPAIPPMIYRKEDLNGIRILGKAIAFQSDVI